MIDTILVPLDGSPVAEAILRSVQPFARLTGASLTLLRVADPLDELGEIMPVDEAVLEDDRSAARSYLAEIAERLMASGLTVFQRLEVGQPAQVIIAAGQEHDLIAMSSHGRSGLSRWMYGSVADKVLRGATTPVLLIRARQDGDVVAALPRRIVVPLDGSEFAEHALPLAISLARLALAELVLVRGTAWAREITHGRMGSASAARLIEHYDAQARDYLATVRERPVMAGLNVVTRLQPQPEAEAILLAAEQAGADLIVMCTHGRGGFGRWMLGSVADRVLQISPTPVLIVRPETPVTYTPPPKSASTTA